MKIIGITGGVGCGKTAVLSYIQSKYHCRVLLADEIAHEVKRPGQVCYEPLVTLLGLDVLLCDGTIDRGAMAGKIFEKESLLKEVNALIHPAVKNYILNIIEKEEKAGALDFLFIEAALLIEEHYDEIVDEMWYIYASEPVRRERLKASRGYSDVKITQIMNRQLPEETFREYCQVVIDNSYSMEETQKQIDRQLGDYR